MLTKVQFTPQPNISLADLVAVLQFLHGTHIVDPVAFAALPASVKQHFNVTQVPA